MSVLSEQFARLRRAVPNSRHPHIRMLVRVEGNQYAASCFDGGGNTEGHGATPEEALREAVGNVIARCRR